MPESEIIDPPISDRRVSGRKVVGVMFLFGLLVTTGMYVYWELYERPFRGVQGALAKAFPGSSPRVIGGRHKSHQQGNPLELRAILRLPIVRRSNVSPLSSPEFSDPTQDDAAMRLMANQIAEIVRREMPVEKYDTLSLFLIHRPPEQVSVTWSISAPPGAYPLPESGPLPEQFEQKLIRADPPK